MHSSTKNEHVILLDTHVLIWLLLDPTKLNQEFVNIVLQRENVTEQHLSELERVSLHHRDPFDRMLIVQAMFEHTSIATLDKKFEHYDVSLVSTTPYVK